MDSASSCRHHRPYTATALPFPFPFPLLECPGWSRRCHIITPQDCLGFSQKERPQSAVCGSSRQANRPAASQMHLPTNERLCNNSSSVGIGASATHPSRAMLPSPISSIHASPCGSNPPLASIPRLLSLGGGFTFSVLSVFSFLFLFLFLNLNPLTLHGNRCCRLRAYACRAQVLLRWPSHNLDALCRHHLFGNNIMQSKRG